MPVRRRAIASYTGQATISSIQVSSLAEDRGEPRDEEIVLSAGVVRPHEEVPKLAEAIRTLDDKALRAYGVPSAYFAPRSVVMRFLA